MATPVDRSTLAPARSKKVAAPARPRQQQAPSTSGADELVRLTNRATTLTFLTAAAFIAALASSPALLSSSTQPFWRVAAAIVVLGAVAGVFAVRRARARLDAAELRAAAGDGAAGRSRG